MKDRLLLNWLHAVQDVFRIKPLIAHHLDFSDPALQHLDRDDPVFDFLFRDKGPSKNITFLGIVGGDLLSH